MYFDQTYDTSEIHTNTVNMYTCPDFGAVPHSNNFSSDKDPHVDFMDFGRISTSL